MGERMCLGCAPEERGGGVEPAVGAAVLDLAGGPGGRAGDDVWLSFTVTFPHSKQLRPSCGPGAQQGRLQDFLCRGCSQSGRDGGLRRSDLTLCPEIVCRNEAPVGRLQASEEAGPGLHGGGGSRIQQELISFCLLN